MSLCCTASWVSPACQQQGSRLLWRGVCVDHYRPNQTKLPETLRAFSERARSSGKFSQELISKILSQNISSSLLGGKACWACIFTSYYSIGGLCVICEDAILWLRSKGFTWFNDMVTHWATSIAPDSNMRKGRRHPLSHLPCNMKTGHSKCLHLTHKIHASFRPIAPQKS